MLGAVAAVIADAAIYYFGAEPLIRYFAGPDCPSNLEFAPAAAKNAGLAVNYALRLSAAAVIATFLSRRGHATVDDLGLTLKDAGRDAVWTAKVIGVLLAGALVLAAAAVGVIRWRHARVDLGSDMELWPVSLLCAPLAEEFVYRSLLVNGLKANYGTKSTLAFSALIFYALHLGYSRPWWHLHYLFAGAILAWAFLQRPRLWIVLLLHAGGNLLVMSDDLLWRFAPKAYQALLGQGR